jgi:S-methylmethionine-dependent homocysteine/selenocysteine methylase
MSSIAEARAAAQAACSTEKPVWVSWTLHEDRSGRLRSGESVKDAITALADLPVRGFLANCCAPEAVSRFLEQSAAVDVPWKGGYANTFSPIPEDWMLDGAGQSDGLLPYRKDLDPESYASHVCNWLDAGATVVGGCCGTRPIHTEKMRQCIDTKFPHLLDRRYHKTPDNI